MILHRSFSTYSGLLLVLLLLCPGVSAAEVYLGLGYGQNRVTDANARDDLGSFTLKFKPAAVQSVALGWRLAESSESGHGRIELEYAQRSNPLNRAVLADGSFAAGGSLAIESLLVNSYGVERIDENSFFYLGLGLGAARVKAQSLTVTGQPLSDSSATAFAYQLGTGFDYTLGDHLTLDLGYRFFATTRPRLREADGRAWRCEYSSHSAMLGLRILF